MEKKMNEEERKEFIIQEIEAIYDEFETSVNQLVLLKSFFKDLISVSKGAKPSSDVVKNIKRIK